jgi:hypothetical protein
LRAATFICRVTVAAHEVLLGRAPRWCYRADARRERGGIFSGTLLFFKSLRELEHDDDVIKRDPGHKTWRLEICATQWLCRSAILRIFGSAK